MTNPFKKSTEHIFRKIGYEIVPTWRLDRHPQSKYLKKLLKNYSIDAVIDVGANNGQYRDYLRDHLEFKGKILSFEPHPACIETLKELAEGDPLWEIYPFALGAHDGALKLNLMQDSQFSSFLNPKHQEKLGRGQGNVVIESVDVEVRSLGSIYDDLMHKNNCSRPFLKLDTQGHDVHVLHGASKVITHLRAIQTELSNIPIYEEVTNIATSITELDRYGFDLGAIFPANPDQFPLATDFDAYFIQRQ